MDRAHRLALPEVFGPWNSAFRRFSRRSRKGVWWRLFEAMSDDRDFEYPMDSTIVCAHQHAAGAPRKGVGIRPLATIQARPSAAHAAA